MLGPGWYWRVVIESQWCVVCGIHVHVRRCVVGSSRQWRPDVATIDSHTYVYMSIHPYIHVHVYTTVYQCLHYIMLHHYACVHVQSLCYGR